MIRLHLVPETPQTGPVWSCAEIRLVRPYRHASLRALFEVTQGHALPPGRIDVVVLQRGGPVGADLGSIVALVRELRARGAKLVYDIDDDLLGRHPVPAVESVIALWRPKIRFLLREADLVVTSTVTLAERLRGFGPRIVVWPNALDERLVQATVASDPSAEIGYFGTFSHLPDLMTVVGSIDAAAAGMAGARFELCGISDDPRLHGLFAPNLRTLMRPIVGNYADFHAMLANEAAWRVGLAPLADSVFTRAKSDIKLLDYAAAGIATVATAHPVYADWTDGETVMTATPDSFGAAVARLLADAEVRRVLAARAREKLLDTRVLARTAPALGAAVQTALEP